MPVDDNHPGSDWGNSSPGVSWGISVRIGRPGEPLPFWCRNHTNPHEQKRGTWSNGAAESQKRFLDEGEHDCPRTKESSGVTTRKLNSVRALARPVIALLENLAA